MANLSGQNIGTNYKGILNLSATINTNLSGTLQVITDGDGNASPLKLSTSAIDVGTFVSFGGITNDFPALKRNGTVLEVKLADDSNYALVRLNSLETQAITIASNNIYFGGAGGVGDVALSRNNISSNISISLNGLSNTHFSFNKIDDTTEVKLIKGSSDPEGAVTATQGSVYMRTGGGAGSSFYVKESGSGNTGWVGK